MNNNFFNNFKLQAMTYYNKTPKKLLRTECFYDDGTKTIHYKDNSQEVIHIDKNILRVLKRFGFWFILAFLFFVGTAIFIIMIFNRYFEIGI